VSHNKIGEVLLAQGNRYAALNVHRTGLSVAEALCRRDPANVQWKVDLAVSYSKLGSLASEIDIQTRRNYLLHGRDILLQLKSVGKLSAAQDYISWFDARGEGDFGGAAGGQGDAFRTGIAAAQVLPAGFGKLVDRDEKIIDRQTHPGMVDQGDFDRHFQKAAAEFRCADPGNVVIDALPELADAVHGHQGEGGYCYTYRKKEGFFQRLPLFER
jgi:hypothetical protein